MTINQRLRYLRKQKRMAVRELAQAIGVPLSTYKGYEYGVRIPAQLVPIICQCLGLTYEEFFGELKTSNLQLCKGKKQLATP